MGGARAIADEGTLEAEMQGQAFNRRSFLGKLAGTAGAAALVAAAAGCQGVQQALGPKTNPPPAGTGSGGSVPSAGSAGATGATPSTSGGAAPAQGAALAPATIRYMGHFTGLGDTARDRAQKQIETKFKAQQSNITIQWEQT